MSLERRPQNTGQEPPLKANAPNPDFVNQSPKQPQEGVFAAIVKGDTLTFNLGGRTVTMPNKQLYENNDFLLVFPTEKPGTFRVQIRTVQESLAIPIQYSTTRTRKKLFLQEGFIAIVHAIWEEKESSNNKGRLVVARNTDEGASVVLPKGKIIADLTKPAKEVLALLIERGKIGETVAREEATEAYINAGGNPTISSRSWKSVINQLSEMLEQADFYPIRSSTGRKNVYFWGKDIPIEENLHEDPMATKRRARRELPLSPKQEERKIIEAKATFEILSIILAGKTSHINVRVILGHHLPEKTSIPQVYGDDENDALNGKLFHSFMDSIGRLWDKDPKTTEGMSEEDIKIMEVLSLLKTQNYTPQRLSSWLSQSLKILP